MSRPILAAVRAVRGVLIFALAFWYLGSAFQLWDGVFWNSGLGDWMDPYFLNYLLEHWYRSVVTFADPSSPPMFHPAPRTLGYSHGLVLYAPIYIVLRPFLHAFQAYNLTLFAVVLLGTLSLYAVFRRYFTLAFREAVLLTAFFVTSPNVMNGLIGVWSQRASVFLIPPILWLALHGDHRTAAVSGLLAALLYVQDFYTAHLAMLFVAAAFVPVLIARVSIDRKRLVAFGSAAALGIAAFLWIYLGAYREHRGFPGEQILAQLIPWGERPAYDSFRPFVLVAGIAVLTVLWRSRLDATTRVTCIWAVLLSAVVLLIPSRFGDFSIWRAIVEPLPGYGAIRDPKRIIYLYELAVVLAVGVFLARIRSRLILRSLVAAFVAILIVTGWQRTTLDYLRPNATFAQWVEAPIAVGPACRSFFIAPASPVYSSRPGSAWSVYHLDAMWIALRYRLPTLNGYSAWNPAGWAIGNPDEPGYADAVRDWTTRNDLDGVCTLDIEARTMRR